MANDALKLIVEHDFFDYDLILEQENKESPKFLKIKGPYIVANKKNANGRIYNLDEMIPEVSRFVTEMVDTGRALGELNHPTSPVIDHSKACHRVTKLTQDGFTWIGESIVLSSSADGTIKGTPNGDILASILQHGGKPGMSTRGIGMVSECSGMVKQYKIVTVDCVSNPSGPGCFINGILESKDFIINQHGDIVESAYEKFENGLMNIPGHSTVSDAGKVYLDSVIREFIKNVNL